MEIEKLEILPEKDGAGLPQFDPQSKEKIICNSDYDNKGVKMFNPSRFTVTRTVAWPSQEVTKRDSPELHHAGAIEPSTLNLELFLDSYDNDLPPEKKKSVREITDKLIKLTHVIDTKHRPPVCRLTWGNVGNMSGFFQGVLENLVLVFSLFFGERHASSRHRNVHVQGMDAERRGLEKSKPHVGRCGEGMDSQAGPDIGLYRNARVRQPGQMATYRYGQWH